MQGAPTAPVERRPVDGARANWLHFGAWREQRLARLDALAGWLRASALEPALWRDAVDAMSDRLRSDVVQLAFVAELSRGKSELINAMFFAGHGRRMIPAGAGRTTMCPLELRAAGPAGARLRLLPFDSRRDPRTVAQWKQQPDAWDEQTIADDAALAAALQRLSQTLALTPDAARALGFHPDGDISDGLPGPALPRTPDGLIDIPRWRHAILEIAHPVLAQGLTVLDTPGLNALGTEPELTLSILPAASAVVFVLAADAGVTRSDLDLWTRHIDPAARARSLVVLNKVDILRDPLLEPEAARAQVERQRESAAHALGVDVAQVFAVSARDALVARIRGDEALLERSGLSELETAVGRMTDAHGRDLADRGWRASLLDVLTQLERHLQQRIQHADDQRAELESLEGKSHQMRRALQLRIGHEQREFDAGAVQVQALHAVNARQLAEVEALLAPAAALAPLAEAGARVRASLIQTGLVDAVDAASRRTIERLHRAEALLGENRAMLAGAGERLNTEFAFALPPPRELGFDGARLEVERFRADVRRNAGPLRWLRLQDPTEARRILAAADERLRALLERAQRDASHWNRAAMAALDAQVRERRRALARRRQTFDHVVEAGGELARRVGELAALAADLRRLRDSMRHVFEATLQ